MQRVRICFVGVGTMGQCAHLRNYAVLPECEVVALAELRPGLAEAVARKYGVPRVYASHEELFANEDVDAIVAAQPFTRHGTLLPELLQAGKPVFIEKPLAGSVEQGERVLAAMRESGTWIMVGYHKRMDPATVAAVAEIGRLRETGELGRLKYVRVTMPPGDWIAGGFDDLVTSDEALPAMAMDPGPSNMTAQEHKEYLVFVNYYIHQVNLLRHLLREPYQVVYADPSGVVLVARSESGVAGCIEMAPYQTTVDWHEEALVGFEQGYVRLRLPAPLARNRAGAVEMYRDPGGGKAPEVVRPVLPWGHAMRAQAERFVRAVRGDEDPACGAEEALEDLRIAEQWLWAK